MIQLRSESTGFQVASTLKDAFQIAKADRSIWKISFDLGLERVRLVLTTEGWLYQDILEAGATVTYGDD